MHFCFIDKQLGKTDTREDFIRPYLRFLRLSHYSILPVPFVKLIYSF